MSGTELIGFRTKGANQIESRRLKLVCTSQPERPKNNITL